jgi:MoaA/NifB/PqqE/SkfB family radical SAM enzyme
MRKKYSMLLKLFSAFIRLYLLKNNVPITANISVTDRCNFSCTHCDLPKRQSKELTTEEIFSVVDALDKAGAVKISLCGGEPLMRQDIGRIIDYIKSKKIMVNIVTNGSLVPQKIDEIKNLDFILLSYDGSAQAQKNVRGEKAHDLAIAAIDAAKSRGIQIITATVLTKDNINEVDSILALGEQKGFRCQFHPVYAHSFSGGSVDNLLPDKRDMLTTAEKLIKIKQGDRPERIVLSTPTLDHMKYWPEFKKQKCWAGNAYVYIDTDGRMYPCIQMIGRTEGVSFFSGPLSEALKALKRLPCQGCWCLSNIEYNYIFSLNPRALWNSSKLSKSLKKQQPGARAHTL